MSAPRHYADHALPGRRFQHLGTCDDCGKTQTPIVWSRKFRCTCCQTCYHSRVYPRDHEGRHRLPFTIAQRQAASRAGGYATHEIKDARPRASYRIQLDDLRELVNKERAIVRSLERKRPTIAHLLGRKV